ncbi:MAG: hypothetical protein KF774_01430 [Planctomyces sp.]|nr:hypothetical protein [Planctomyces sp.]
MHPWILVAALTSCGGCGDSVSGSTSASQATATIAPMLETGALIYTKGDCLAVRVYTGSRVTHVAAVVLKPEGAWVYDSTSGVGVRKLPLAEYLGTQSPGGLIVCRPRRPMSDEQACDFETYLESQIGRSYSVKHHLTGRRNDGIHCAEYATEALLTTELITANNPVRVSPASLLEGVLQNGIYQPAFDGELIAAPTEAEAAPRDEGRCRRMWRETKECCSNCCRKLSGWVLCR